MLTSNVPRKETRSEMTESASLLRVLLRVYRASRVLALGAETLGNRMFREGGAGDLLFLRQALEDAAPWVNKEVKQ